MSDNAKRWWEHKERKIAMREAAKVAKTHNKQRWIAVSSRGTAKKHKIAANRAPLVSHPSPVASAPAPAPVEFYDDAREDIEGETATVWLQEQLPCRVADVVKLWGGEMKKDILGLPDKEEIARIQEKQRQLNAARVELGLEAVIGGDGQWWWELPKNNVKKCDPWESQIEYFLQTHTGDIPMSDLLGSQCLDIPMERQNRACSSRVGRIMYRLGYTKKRPRAKDGTVKREYVYSKE
jgi:hypothetical protein